MGLAPTAFSLEATAQADPVTLARVLVLGVLLAALSILFCELLHLTPKQYSRFSPTRICGWLWAVC